MDVTPNDHKRSVIKHNVVFLCVYVMEEVFVRCGTKKGSPPIVICLMYYYNLHSPLSPLQTTYPICRNVRVIDAVY